MHDAALHAQRLAAAQDEQARLLHSLRLLLATAGRDADGAVSLQPATLDACGHLVRLAVVGAARGAPTPQTMRVAATATALALDVAHVWSAQQAAQAARGEGAAPRGRGLSRLGPAGGPATADEPAAREAQVRLLRAVGRTASAWLRAGESSEGDADAMSDTDAMETEGVQSPRDPITRQLLSTVLLLASECARLPDAIFLLQPVWQALLPPLCRVVARPETPPATTLVALQLLSSAAGPQGLPMQEVLAVFEPHLRAVSTLWRLLQTAGREANNTGAPAFSRLFSKVGTTLCGALVCSWSTTLVS